MDIKEFSLQLQNLYEEMGKTFRDFQTSSGLTCLSGCSECCLNPEVEATPLEMIPMALKIIELGLIDQIYQELENSEGLPCIVLKNGKCSLYEQRPSLCRLFGASGFIDKNGKTSLSLCKLIKKDKPQLAENLSSFPPTETPIMANWSRILSTLHPELNKNRQQINVALKMALDQVALYLNYQSNSDT